MFSIKLPLMASLMFVTCTHAITVKYGTKDGPIEPPTPEPTPAPQPYRIPAPVWEDRSDDSPDPNAQWRPPFFRPQPRYTEVIFKTPSTPPTSNVQSFVNSYLSNQPIKPKVVQTFFTPSRILTSQNLPGVGIRYFIPAYNYELLDVKQLKKQDDAKNNEIETNDIGDSSKDTSSDAQWKLEKDAATRLHRNTIEGTVRPYYQWPAYVDPRH